MIDHTNGSHGQHTGLDQHLSTDRTQTFKPTSPPPSPAGPSQAVWAEDALQAALAAALVAVNGTRVLVESAAAGDDDQTLLRRLGLLVDLVRQREGHIRPVAILLRQVAALPDTTACELCLDYARQVLLAVREICRPLKVGELPLPDLDECRPHLDAIRACLSQWAGLDFRGLAGRAKQEHARALGLLRQVAAPAANQRQEDAEHLERLYPGQTGERLPATLESVPPQYVTLDQIAAVVSRSKRTVEKLLTRKKNPMPTPDIEGGGGKPNEWEWATIQPWLEKEFGRNLPERYPALRRN
jgi:hypothetical protein